MGVNRNLLGGIALRDAIKKAIPSATDNPDERYIEFAANATASDSISGAAGMVFKSATQYSFIMTRCNTSTKASNLVVNYSDNTQSAVPNVSASNAKETAVLVSTAGKTISSFSNGYYSGVTRVYYDESGIFEGVLTTLDFEPYQAWGITMSGVRRSLVEAALHDDTTVAAPIATFTTDVAAPAKSVLAAFSPIQDLHGYDNPWPAGGSANKWDEVWDVGGISSSTGENIPQANTIRSTNYIPISAETDYYVECTKTGIGANYIYLFYYDSGKDYIGSSGGYVGKGAKTTPVNSAYMRFQMVANYGASYANDIMINYPSSVTTYSPYSNICPISGRTGLTVTRTGVNLLNPDEVAMINSTATNIRAGIVFDKAGTYTVKANAVGTQTGVYISARVKSADGTYGTAQTVVINSALSSARTFTVADGGTLILFNVIDSGTVSATKTLFADYEVQVEVGSSASAYAAYTGNTYPVTWQTEAGTVYGGTLDIVSGVLTVTWVEQQTPSANPAIIGTYADRKDCGWSYSQKARGTLNVKSQAFKTSHVSGTPPIYCVSGREVNSYVTFGVPIEYADTAADAGNYIRSVSPTICYELATPATYQLTPTQIQMLKGANNLWQSENGDVTVGYWLHG